MENIPVQNQDQAEVRRDLAHLRQEHADLDAAIAAMQSIGGDPLQIQRIKKKKLQLKDQIQKLEDALIPDIIA